MKIYIERKPKEPKQKKVKKPKKQKVMSVGPHKRMVIILWSLLVISLAFGIYKNFTVIDRHTVHEKEVVETKVVDTNAIESFTKKFIQAYYTWENDKDALEQRTTKMNQFLTPELQELNVDTIRVDIPTSSSVSDFMIWEVEKAGKDCYTVLYSVNQTIKEEDDTKRISSNYRITVYQDENRNLIITQNPTFWSIPKQSDYEPEKIESDNTVDSDTENEIKEFLETFFKLYPTATKSELAYYVQDDTLPMIDKEYAFSELVDPIFQREGEQFKVYLSVKYLDDVSKVSHAVQYELMLEKVDNWKIVDVN